MGRMSITTKITIWYAVFMLLISAMFVGVMLYRGNSMATTLIKTRLEERVDDVANELQQLGSKPIIDSEIEYYEDGIYISIYDSTGNIIEGRTPATIEQLENLQSGEIRKITDRNSDGWYVYDEAFGEGDNTVWVRGIINDSAEQGTFSFMLKVALIGFPVMIIVAMIGGYVITRRGFGPINSIIGTVEEISDDADLSRRIQLPARTEVAQDEVYRLATTFNNMFEKLEKTFIKEKQFTSDVSHELRTPLAVIISQSDYAKEDPEYSAKAMETISREARRMNSLVNRLLTLVRSDADNLKVGAEVIDFSELCHSIAEQQESIVEEAGATLEVDISDGIKVTGEADMLIRAVLNLIDNAIKYGVNSEGESVITLRLKRDDVNACCTVEDNGEGISPENLQHIWERFYRADVARSDGSSGLGLPIVKALIEVHGGSVEATSEKGRGSSFTLSIPLTQN